MDIFLKQIIIEAGEVAKKYFEKGVRHTFKNNRADLLTEADIAVSDFLVGKIQKEYPDHQIHSEEMKEDVHPGGEYAWIIDPIDGTRNFAMGIPLWCQMIGVTKGGELHLAGIYNPLADELFFAEKGKGAYVNDRRIWVNGNVELAYSYGILAAAPIGTHIERYQKAVERYILAQGWHHDFGTVLAAAYVASGGIDFYAINCGLDHDYVAAALLCREAGAHVTDSDGNPWVQGRRDIVIGNPGIHEKLMQLLFI